MGRLRPALVDLLCLFIITNGGAYIYARMLHLLNVYRARASSINYYDVPTPALAQAVMRPGETVLLSGRERFATLVKFD